VSFQTISSDTINRDARWDAEFYGPDFGAIANALLAHGAVPLRQFVKQANRGLLPLYAASGAVRVINSVNVRDLEISQDRQSLVDHSYLANNPVAAVQPGDLMVTSTGIGTMGRIFCNLSEDTYFADGHITILRLYDPKIAPYLCAFLQSSVGRKQFIQRRRGSSRQVEIYPEDILSILVPPLEHLREQIVKDWLTAVQEIADARQAYPKAEKTILESVAWARIVESKAPNNFVSSMRDVRERSRLDPEFFAPRQHEIERALVKSGGLKFRELEDGYTKGVQPEGYAMDGGLTVIKSKDVLRTGINMTTCDHAHFHEVQDGHGIVAEGMLVMNMTGVGTLGRTSVVPKHSGTAVISVDVSGWSLRPGIVPVEYVSLFLNSPVGMAQTLRYQTGSSGQLHLYPEHVRNLWIFVKRDSAGSIVKEWHEELAVMIRSASKKQTHASARLDAIHARIASCVGLNPRLVRE
jgi:hypothetical protein